MARYFIYQTIEVTVPAGATAGTVYPQQTLFKGNFDPGYVTGICVQELSNPGNLVWEAGMDVGNGQSVVNFVLSPLLTPSTSVAMSDRFLEIQPQDANTYCIFKARVVTSSAQPTVLRMVFRIEDLTPEQAQRKLTSYSTKC